MAHRLRIRLAAHVASALHPVLAEMGLPQGARLVALVAFVNLGVETGQLAVVLAVDAAGLYLLRSTDFYRRGVMPWGSTASCLPRAVLVCGSAKRCRDLNPLLHCNACAHERAQRMAPGANRGIAGTITRILDTLAVAVRRAERFRAQRSVRIPWFGGTAAIRRAKRAAQEGMAVAQTSHRHRAQA